MAEGGPRNLRIQIDASRGEFGGISRVVAEISVDVLDEAVDKAVRASSAAPGAIEVLTLEFLQLEQEAKEKAFADCMMAACRTPLRELCEHVAEEWLKGNPY